LSPSEASDLRTFTALACECLACECLIKNGSAYGNRTQGPSKSEFREFAVNPRQYRPKSTPRPRSPAEKSDHSRKTETFGRLFVMLCHALGFPWARFGTERRAA
jgi:hypothetical protein